MINSRVQEARRQTPRLNFPPQTGAYAVKVKNGAGWREFDVARLQISVGQPYHEGDKLAATLDWLRHRFQHVIVCINDTLQSSNLQFEEQLPARHAFTKASDAGADWIARNRSLVAQLPSFELHRWEDWKTSPDFANSMSRTMQMYQTNHEFRDAVQTDIENRWQRRMCNSSSTGSKDFAEFKRFSEHYLLEETAVFSLMYARDRAVDVYPGTALLPCTVFQGREIQGAPEGLGRGAFTRIDFARRKTPTPQAA